MLLLPGLMGYSWADAWLHLCSLISYLSSSSLELVAASQTSYLIISYFSESLWLFTRRIRSILLPSLILFEAVVQVVWVHACNVLVLIALPVVSKPG